MTDQKPRDFYWGDVLQYEVRSKEGDVWTFTGSVVGFYRNRGFVDQVVLNHKPGHAEGFPVKSCVHASDGAPLGKFRGISRESMGLVPDFDGCDYLDEVSLDEVNRILGAEVDE